MRRTVWSSTTEKQWVCPGTEAIVCARPLQSAASPERLKLGVAACALSLKVALLRFTLTPTATEAPMTAIAAMATAAVLRREFASSA